MTELLSELFNTNNVVEGIKVKERYDELMACFKEEMSLHAPV